MTTLSTLVRPMLSKGNVKRLASLSLRSPTSCCHHTAAITSCRPQLMIHNHYILNHHRHQSTSSSIDNDNGPNNNNSTILPPTFPWRHSPTPPTRLLENDDYSGMPNNWRARYVRRLIAAKELNLSFWHVIPLPQLFGQQHEWEEELASNFSVAFSLAMKELMETLFDNGEHNNNSSVRYDEDEQRLSLEVTLDSNNRDTTISSSSSSSLSTSTEDSSDDTTSEDDPTAENSNDSNMSLEDNAYLNSMMDQLLLQQYQHLLDYNNNKHHHHHHHHHPISIHLSLKPINAQLKNIFAVPMLTREIVASKPHLKGGYQRLEKVFKETQSYNEVKQKTYELAEQVGLESAKRTVIAEATVTCLEYFQVKDLESGRVLQGMEDDGVEEAEEVVHLVRFEMVTDRGEDGKREGGNWKLIDVDDLLEGNVFH